MTTPFPPPPPRVLDRHNKEASEFDAMVKQHVCEAEETIILKVGGVRFMPGQRSISPFCACEWGCLWVIHAECYGHCPVK